MGQAADAFLSRYRQPWPYATDRLRDGVRREERSDALRRRYIQANPRCLAYCLVMDIDHQDALVRAFRTGLPVPSWVSESPSGRAHAGYLLAVPFSTADQAQTRTLRLAARVQEGLRRQLDADPGYSGLMTKNPLHPDWLTTWGTDELHSLAAMARDLGTDLPKAVRKRAADDGAGLGRNCLLFEQARHWAYAAVRRYWQDGLDPFQDAVRDHLALLNAQLPVPLDAPEVQAIAKSISTWTWRNMTPASFQATQARRAAKGNQTITARAREREQAVLALRDQGLRWQVIADTLGMSERAARQVGVRARKNDTNAISDNDPPGPGS
jgi:hypothetical protein